MKFSERAKGTMYWEADAPGYRIVVSDMANGLTYQAMFGTQVLRFARGVKKGDAEATRGALLDMKSVCEEHKLSGSSGF